MQLFKFWESVKQKNTYNFDLKKKRNFLWLFKKIKD